MNLDTVAGVFLGSFGLLTVQRFGRQWISRPPKIGEISYEFNPGSPETIPNGWTYDYKEPGVRVEYRIPAEQPVAGCIEILPTGVYALIRPISPALSLAKRLKFKCLFSSRDSTIYVWFRCAHRDGGTRDVRIAYRAGNGKPFPWKDGTVEWVVLVEGRSIRNGWRDFDIFIPADVEQTYGTAGFSFKMFTRISLRGHICVSPIELFEA